MLLCLGSGIIIYICTLSISSMLSFLYLKSSGWKKACLFRFIYGSDNYIDKCYYHKLPGHQTQLQIAVSYCPYLLDFFLPRSHHRNSSPESASRGININLYESVLFIRLSLLRCINTRNHNFHVYRTPLWEMMMPINGH